MNFPYRFSKSTQISIFTKFRPVFHADEQTLDRMTGGKTWWS